MEKNTDRIQDEDLSLFNRRFKYAVIAYAIIEFIVIAAVIYCKMMSSATHG